jgi:hypothetical protein
MVLDQEACDFYVNKRELEVANDTAARRAMHERLVDGVELSARQLREDVDELAGRVSRYEHEP